MVLARLLISVGTGTLQPLPGIALPSARVRGVVGYRVKLLRTAIDTLMAIGGASAFAEKSPLQRMWQDVNIATRHALLATDLALEMYARALLGVKGSISPMV